MKYRVVYGHSLIQKRVEETLESIAPIKVQDQIMDVILNLGSGPRPSGIIKIKPPLTIQHSLAQYRIRIGNHRLFYDIDDERKVVTIVALRKRNESTYK